MAEEQEMCPAILKALKVSQRGLTVTDISRKIRHNRNSTAQQLEILRGRGKGRSGGDFTLDGALPLAAWASPEPETGCRNV
jgi:hypothetical protein